MATRYSDFFVTINSHIKPVDEVMRDELAQTMLEILHKQFYTRETMHAVFRLGPTADAPDPRLLTAELVGETAVEVGKVKHQLHLHFVLSVAHTGNLLLARNEYTINTALKAWWDEALGPHWDRKCHANAQLLPTSRVKNYAVKKGAAAGGAVSHVVVHPRREGVAEEQGDAR